MATTRQKKRFGPDEIVTPFESFAFDPIPAAPTGMAMAGSRYAGNHPLVLANPGRFVRIDAPSAEVHAAREALRPELPIEEDPPMTTILEATLRVVRSVSVSFEAGETVRANDPAAAVMWQLHPDAFDVVRGE